MWILSDVGTTNAKFYRWDGESVVLDVIIPSDEIGPEVWRRFDGFEVKAGFSVRPDVRFPDDWIVLDRDEPWGFDVAVDMSTVGVDRLLAVEGAYSLGVRDGIVAMFGTANVVNVLKGGVFVGGGIAPGFSLQANALFLGIPHLRNFSPEIPGVPFGDNTGKAIGAGVYWAHPMWLYGLKMYLNLPRVLVTGGGAEVVSGLLDKLGLEFVPTLIPMGMLSVLKRKKGEP